MDDKGYKPSEGSCIISEDVIATIASTAALEVQGVASMAQRPTDIRGLISSAAAKSVKVLNNENETSIDVYVNLRLGVRIQDVAGEVQHGVKVAVQSDDRASPGDQGQRACGRHRFRRGKGRSLSGRRRHDGIADPPQACGGSLPIPESVASCRL